MNNIKSDQNKKQFNQKKEDVKQQPKSQPTQSRQPLQTNQKQYSGSDAEKSKGFTSKKAAHDDAKIDRDSKDSFPASDSPSYR